MQNKIKFDKKKNGEKSNLNKMYKWKLYIHLMPMRDNIIMVIVYDNGIQLCIQNEIENILDLGMCVVCIRSHICIQVGMKNYMQIINTFTILTNNKLYIMQV